MDGSSVLIDLSDIFLTDSPSSASAASTAAGRTGTRSRRFPNNIELEVEATFSGGGGARITAATDGVGRPRGVTVVIHYSLVKLPEAATNPATPTIASATS